MSASIVTLPCGCFFAGRDFHACQAHADDTEVAMTAELGAWCAEQNLEWISADELLLDENLKPEQRQYLSGFVVRWEAALAKEDTN